MQTRHALSRNHQTTSPAMYLAGDATDIEYALTRAAHTGQPLVISYYESPPPPVRASTIGWMIVVGALALAVIVTTILVVFQPAPTSPPITVLPPAITVVVTSVPVVQPQPQPQPQPETLPQPQPQPQPETLPQTNADAPAAPVEAPPADANPPVVASPPETNGNNAPVAPDTNTNPPPVGVAPPSGGESAPPAAPQWVPAPDVVIGQLPPATPIVVPGTSGHHRVNNPGGVVTPVPTLPPATPTCALCHGHP